MPQSETQSPPASSTEGAQRFSAVRMPIEEPIDDLDEAVQKLNNCSSTELRRARQHHQRAVEALQNGGYNALSDATRDHLLKRLRNNLEALNRALDTSNTSRDADPAKSSPETAPTSFSSRFRAFFEGLW